MANVVIWTTTPWTLPANQAVALHSDLDYAALVHDSQIYIVAEGLAEQCCERYGWDATPLCTFKGACLEGLLLEHPLYGYTVSVVMGAHVSLDAGTGCVHIAPAHGVDDYVLGQRYELPCQTPLQDNAVFAPEAGFLAGHHLRKTDALIIEKLKENREFIAQLRLRT